MHPIAKRIKAFGFDISVETPKGSHRHWKDPHSGESGSTKMLYDYGYIRRTEGTDGDHVDVYVGPNAQSDRVFIIDQLKKPDFKQFDEQKVMLGFDDADSAKAAYLKHYNDPRFFGSMREMRLDTFRDKVLDKENHGNKIAQETEMPFKSKAQARAALGGHIPGFSKEKAEEWAHKTKNMKKLPEHVSDKKSKKHAEQSVLSDHNDPPGYMMVQNLNQLADQAGELSGAVSVEDNAEPWVESKIDRAAQAIDAVHDYMKYKTERASMQPEKLAVFNPELLENALRRAERVHLQNTGVVLPEARRQLFGKGLSRLAEDVADPRHGARALENLKELASEYKWSEPHGFPVNWPELARTEGGMAALRSLGLKR